MNSEKVRKLRTNSFMHEISASISTLRPGEKFQSLRPVRSLKKKSKAQKINSRFFFLTPNSKFFQNQSQKDMSAEKEKVKEKEKEKEMLKVDLGFLKFDFKYQLNKLFKLLIIPILESKVLIIGNSEKQVRCAWEFSRK